MPAPIPIQSISTQQSNDSKMIQSGSPLVSTTLSVDSDSDSDSSSLSPAGLETTAPLVLNSFKTPLSELALEGLIRNIERQPGLISALPLCLEQNIQYMIHSIPTRIVTDKTNPEVLDAIISLDNLLNKPLFSDDTLSSDDIEYTYIKDYILKNSVDIAIDLLAVLPTTAFVSHVKELCRNGKIDISKLSTIQTNLSYFCTFVYKKDLISQNLCGDPIKIESIIQLYFMVFSKRFPSACNFEKPSNDRPTDTDLDKYYSCPIPASLLVDYLININLNSDHKTYKIDIIWFMSMDDENCSEFLNHVLVELYNKYKETSDQLEKTALKETITLFIRIFNSYNQASNTMKIQFTKLSTHLTAYITI